MTAYVKRLESIAKLMQTEKDPIKRELYKGVLRGTLNKLQERGK